MPDSINFFKGHPSLTILPNKEIAKSYNKILLESDHVQYADDPLNRHPLTYGTDPGNYEVRQTISKWNDRLFERSNSDPNSINLTGGASYGMANILTSATDTFAITKRGFIVTPTYYLINTTFINAGFEGKLTGIEETPNGAYDIDLRYLEDQLKFYSEGLESCDGKEINVLEESSGVRKIYRFVIYLVPTFSNPGGLTYSLETRIKLIKLARKYDMLIVSDDVYELLNYSKSKILPRLNYLDQDSLPSYKLYGNTISNATFSKIVAPGLRVGWQETATSKLANQLASTGANVSGGTPAQLSTFVIKDLIKSGELDVIIQRFNEVYKSRVETLKRSIVKYLPPTTIVRGGDGGYFLWIEILGKIDHNQIVKGLREKYGVILASGDNFEVEGDHKGWGKNCVRVSISYLNSSEIEEGIEKWGNLLKLEHPELY